MRARSPLQQLADRLLVVSHARPVRGAARALVEVFPREQFQFVKIEDLESRPAGGARRRVRVPRPAADAQAESCRSCTIAGAKRRCQPAERAGSRSTSGRTTSGSTRCSASTWAGTARRMAETVFITGAARGSRPGDRGGVRRNRRGSGPARHLRARRGVPLSDGHAGRSRGDGRDTAAAGEARRRPARPTSEADEVAAAVRRGREELGPMDVLVNNAGIVGPAGVPAHELDEEAWTSWSTST